jgi:hypothetical protein
MNGVRGNDEILADPAAFMAVYDRAVEAFGKLPGVEGVGFGHKNTGGEFTGDVAIVVFVRVKKAEADLPEDQRIPSEFEGYRVDVRKVIELSPGGCNNDTAYSTIRGGIQISVGNLGAPGTLGCIVRRRGDPGRENVFLLTNSHVLTSGGPIGEYVYHPYGPGTGKPSTALGPGEANAVFDNKQSSVPDPSGTPVTMPFFVDGGIARIAIDSKCWGSTCTKDQIEYEPSIVELQLHSVDTISDVRSIARDPTILVPSASPAGTGPFVYKVGRTTGRTRGIVRSVTATVHMGASPEAHTPAIVAQNMIELDFDTTSTSNGLNCQNHAWFAERGDSGSLLVDENNRAIGLISGVPDARIPSPPNAPAAACHILPVLDHLGIAIATSGGTSHGSSHATDGSGVASVATGGDEESTGTGFRFTGAALGDAPAVPADPRPVTSDEQERLFALRDAFRSTERGRHYHALFAEVRREIGYLVRNCRPVKVTWMRSQGPAWLALVLDHLRGGRDEVPLTINGVERADMLRRMAGVLTLHGSRPLARALGAHGDELIALFSVGTTVDHWLALLEASPALAGQLSPSAVAAG